MHYQTAAMVAVAILGHTALCVFLINRIHATGLSHGWVRLIDLLWYACVLTPPLLLLAHTVGIVDLRWNMAVSTTLTAYGWICVAMAAIASIQWMVGRQIGEEAQLRSNHTQRIDVVDRLGRVPSGSLPTSMARRLPGNQVFDLHVHDKQLVLPRLRSSLEGLTLMHLSDLHFTGRVTKDYFQLIVELANERPSDLVLISGDIIDKWVCFPWLSEVLGRLQSRSATCFVLGNHDLRLHDEHRLRLELTEQGMIDLGQRFHVCEIRHQSVVLAGNEQPWFRPVPDLSAAPQGDLRIAVSHSPDQFAWARANQMDVMLAGHTHGGQIRLPIIGPVFSPSRYGVRYSAGTFFEPPTVMHVSRGLSGTRPLRFNCPPEIARLELVRA